MISRIRRTLAFLTGLACAAVIAAPVSAEGDADVPITEAEVRMSHVPSFVYAGMYVAVERGYFAERGLDVELVIVRGGDTTFQVANQTLQFAGGSPDAAFFNALERDLPVMSVGSLAANPMDRSTTPLVVRKDLFESGQVQKVADLEGMKVANLVPGGITEYLTALALGVGDLTIDTVDYVSPMRFPQMVDALSTETIDAALVAEPFAAMAEQRDIAVRLSTEHDLGEQILFIKTNREFAEENPDVVVNFLIGYLKGARDLADGGFVKPENMEIIQKYTEVSPEIINAAVTPILPPNGEFNEDSIMAQQRFHMDMDRLEYDELKPADSFLERSYLERAVAFLGAHENK